MGLLSRSVRRLTGRCYRATSRRCYRRFGEERIQNSEGRRQKVFVLDSSFCILPPEFLAKKRRLLMATSASEFVEQLRAYIREQEKAPLYGKNFFNGVMAGTVDREALKKWAIQHHYRTGQHIRALGGIFLNTGLSPLDQKIRRHIVE